MNLWKRIAGLAGLLMTFGLSAGLIAVTLHPALLAPPEVRPPHPLAELVRSSTVWDGRGLHTVRVYRAPVTMRDVLEWYFDEDMIARYRAVVEPRVFNYGFNTPLPNWPFPYLILARHSDVNFADHDDHIEVVTDTSYYWRYIGP
jgi:hypothetical protein